MKSFAYRMRCLGLVCLSLTVVAGCVPKTPLQPSDLQLTGKKLPQKKALAQARQGTQQAEVNVRARQSVLKGICRYSDSGAYLHPFSNFGVGKAATAPTPFSKLDAFAYRFIIPQELRHGYIVRLQTVNEKGKMQACFAYWSTYHVSHKQEAARARSDAVMAVDALVSLGARYRPDIKQHTAPTNR